MLAFVVKRLVATVPVVLMVMVVLFAILRLTPGDPATIIAGDAASTEQLAEIRNRMGLDEPIHQQFRLWLVALTQGDLGVSLTTSAPVSSLIAYRAGPTLALAACTIILSVAIGVPLGVLAAWRQDTALDRAVMTFSVVGFSIPVFVTGYLLVLVFSIFLGWLPVQGYKEISGGVLPFISHLILPTVALSTVYVTLIARMTRASTLEVIQEDFIRTARAKGAPETSVMMRHALRNAAVPIVTVVGAGIAFLIGGVVVTESVFNIPGLGRLVVEAVLARDYPVIQGLILVFAICNVLVNLLVDLAYGALDPRISL